MKKKVSKKKVARKAVIVKKAQKASHPRKQFVKPRVRVLGTVVGPDVFHLRNAPVLPRFIYVEARRFEDDGLISFDHIEVLGARTEEEAYAFGFTQLDTRQEANAPEDNPHLLATRANDYVVTL